MVMGAATVLLVAGSAKIVQPAPVAATLAELWQAIGGRPRGSGWQFSGRLLGVFEVVLACVIVIERSAAAALALLLFAVGLAVVGVVGIASTSKVSCACFGWSDRTLGWPQILLNSASGAGWGGDLEGCGRVGRLQLRTLSPDSTLRSGQRRQRAGRRPADSEGIQAIHVTLNETGDRAVSGREPLEWSKPSSTTIGLRAAKLV